MTSAIIQNPSANSIAEIAAIAGDPARAAMLCALMGGKALTAGELAAVAGITPQTASGHIARMAATRLVVPEKQGRHRYVRLASADVADMIKALMTLAVVAPGRHRPPGPKDAGLRLARTCYDHLAGRLAVALIEGFVADGWVELADGAGLVTDEGRRFFCDVGVDPGWTIRSARPLCRTCLDWSERRPHLAGRLGAALLLRLRDLRLVEPVAASRALKITRAGETELPRLFGLAENWREG
jgi:DNA-binding transcriptional ArsR family regulator